MEYAKNENNELQEEKIKELGVYYLYYLCTILEKHFSASKGIDGNLRKDLKFRKLLREDFLEECENIEVYSCLSINEFSVDKDISVNLADLFIKEVENMLRADGFDRCKLYNLLFEHTEFLVYYFLGVRIDVNSFYFNNIVDFFLKTIQRIAHSKDKESLLKSSESIEQKEGESPFQKADREDNEGFDDKFVENVEKFGYGIASILKPKMEDMKRLIVSEFVGINDAFFIYISQFFRKLQTEYMSYYMDKLLRIHDANSMREFFESKKDLKFIPTEDLKELL